MRSNIDWPSLNEETDPKPNAFTTGELAFEARIHTDSATNYDKESDDLGNLYTGQIEYIVLHYFKGDSYGSEWRLVIKREEGGRFSRRGLIYMRVDPATVDTRADGDKQVIRLI